MEKIIHYCWFGPKPLGKLEKKCLKSWEKFFPDYKIMKWSEENVDLEECEFIKEAYAQKKWAYVADYVRTKALYEYGGIYFDTDMEIIADMNEFIDKGLVLGLEDSTRPNGAVVIVDKKHNKYIKKLLDKYKIMKFNETGDLFDICIPKQLEWLLEPYGLELGSNEVQVLNKDIFIYPRDYFYPLSYDMQNNIFTENTKTIHHFSASWTNTGEKIAVWLKRHKMAWAVKPAWTINYKYRRIKKRLLGGKNEKNKYILILFSFLLSISSICGLLFKDSAKEKHNILVEIEKENNKNIYIETLDINNNNYLANQKFDYNEKKEIYSLKENNIEFTVTNNDNYLLNIQDKNIKNINVYDNEKEIDVFYDEENHLYNISRSINKYEILKQQFNKTNLILILFLGITFAVLYYFVFLFFKNFVCKIFYKKFKIYEVFIFAGLLFILYYLNFYSLLSLIGYLFIPILFAIMGLTLLHYGKQNKLSFESSYLFMALVLLITLVFLIPPFHILDEDNHYIKSYDHLFLLEKSNFDQNGYTHLSKNIHEFRYKYSNFKFNLIKLNPIAYYDDMNLKINYKDLNGGAEPCGTYKHHVLDYIPSNFVIFLCKKLNTNVLLTILLSRFFNVVLSVLIGYFALKIMPKFKNLLFLIMTFANTYQSCIGINQDWINTPTCFFFIAYIFNLIFKKEQVKIKDYIILILIGTVIAFSKTVYTPIILFVLMIDNKKFEKTKIKHAFINKILLIITVALITFLAYKWNAIFASDNNTTEQVVINNNLYTVSEALNDPVEFILMWFRTIEARLFEDTLKGFIDGFGWYTIWNNKIIKLFMLITYVGLIITLPYEKIKNRGIFKTLSLFIYTSICLLIGAALLFSWTKTGAKTIDGLQPRYFIPIIFGLYFILNNNIFKISKIKNYNTYFIYVIFGLNFISFFEIIYRLF